MKNTQFLIVGAGIMGLTIARELLRHGVKHITIIEKESQLGAHASGRNSGVLHAGIYYPNESQKAKYCVAGNDLLHAYCDAHHLPIRRCGKVVVARNEGEQHTLDTLQQRAVANGAQVRWVSGDELAELEPNARSWGDRALFSEKTSVVDPRAVLTCLLDELRAVDTVQVQFETAFLGVVSDGVIRSSVGDISYEYLINTAGAYSDKIAHEFGVGLRYRLIPFKGIYKKVVPHRAASFRRHIYPVPDLRNPFLGVHFTVAADGSVYAGPTAMPAFGAENYALMPTDWKEALSILFSDAVLFFSNPGFRSVALTEPKKYWDRWFYQDAKSLVGALMPEELIACSKVGIRPQLVDWDNKQLVMDFVVDYQKKACHVLNAISPAFTCSMAMAKEIVGQILTRP